MNLHSTPFYIAGILCFNFFFHFLCEALPHPVHKTVRGHQKWAQIPRSILISEKDTLAVVLLNAEKGQKRGY